MRVDGTLPRATTSCHPSQHNRIHPRVGVNKNNHEKAQVVGSQALQPPTCRHGVAVTDKLPRLSDLLSLSRKAQEGPAKMI